MSPKIRVPLLFIGLTVALMLVPAAHRGDRSGHTAEAIPAVEREVKDRPSPLSARTEAPDLPGITLHHAP